MSAPALPEPGPDAVVAVTAACPSVVRVSGGVGGEIATYLPGRRVPGVRITDDAVEVHVVARYGPTVTEIAEEVRAALAPLAAGRRIDVGVDDLALPGEPAADLVLPGGPAADLGFPAGPVGGASGPVGGVPAR